MGWFIFCQRLFYSFLAMFVNIFYIFDIHNAITLHQYASEHNLKAKYEKPIDSNDDYILSNDYINGAISFKCLFASKYNS